MLKYKIDVGDALKRRGFGTYQAKKSGILSQDTLKKIKEENTGLSLKSLNALCLLLDMQPGQLLTYEETEEDRKLLEKL